MIIDAGVSELRQAFNAHMIASKQTKGISRYLLLFYGAECGLKSIWLRQHGYRKTSQIPDQTLLSQDGHNLSRWISEVGVYSNTVGDPPNFSF